MAGSEFDEAGNRIQTGQLTHKTGNQIKFGEVPGNQARLKVYDDNSGTYAIYGTYADLQEIFNEIT